MPEETVWSQGLIQQTFQMSFLAGGISWVTGVGSAADTVTAVSRLAAVQTTIERMWSSPCFIHR
jgi:hypothetical protein